MSFLFSWILAFQLSTISVVARAEHGEGKYPKQRPTQVQAPEPAAVQNEELTEEDELWIEYNKNTRNEAPEQVLIDTIKPLTSEKQNPLVAIDLGAGGGRDTIALLSRNWKVIAVDRTKQSMDSLEKRAARFKGMLEIRRESFQEMKLAPSSADLVNASYALPFMEKDELKKVWPGIAAAVKPGGKFVGQFFSPEHGWNGTPNGDGRNFLTKEEVIKLIRDSGLVIEKIELKGWDQGSTPWRVFDVVASQPAKK